MMQWWYYRGRVTATIDLPGEPGYVLRPRQKFQAPMPSVAELVRKKLISPIKPPKVAPVAKEVPAKKLATKSDPVEEATPAPRPEHVVASEATKAEETQKAPEVPEVIEAAVGEGEDDSSTEPSEEEPQEGDAGSDSSETAKPTTRKRKRRGRN